MFSFGIDTFLPANTLGCTLSRHREHRASISHRDKTLIRTAVALFSRLHCATSYIAAHLVRAIRARARACTYNQHAAGRRVSLSYTRGVSRPSAPSYFRRRHVEFGLGRRADKRGRRRRRGRGALPTGPRPRPPCLACRVRHFSTRCALFPANRSRRRRRRAVQTGPLRGGAYSSADREYIRGTADAESGYRRARVRERKREKIRTSRLRDRNAPLSDVEVALAYIRYCV